MAKISKITLELSVDELNAKINEFEQNLFKLDMQHRMGQLTKTSDIKTIRKNVARAKTFLSQKTQG